MKQIIGKRKKKVKLNNLRKILRNFLLYTLLICQPLDGILTYMGVSRWGIIAEGNPLIRSSMGSIGIIPAILLFKIIAFILALFFIFYKDFFFNGSIKLADILLFFISNLYIIVVVIWIYVLFGVKDVVF